MAITCEAIDELAGAYALDALPADELEEVEGHLSICSNLHESLGELAEVASLLAFVSETAAPPDYLGPRILSLAGAERDDPTSPTAALKANAGLAIVALPRRRSSAGPFALAAAALALVALGMGAWGLAQRNASESSRVEAGRDRQVLTALAAGGTVVQTPATASLPAALVVQPADGSPAYLVVEWPPATGGMTYQAWLIIQGRPASAGVFDGTGDGPQVIRLTRAIGGAQALAFTLEPHGGSLEPTNKPFVVQPLSS